MGKLKKIGIGFGVTILAFFVFVIIVGITYDETDNVKPQENITQLEKTISEKESETYAPTTILTEKEVIPQVDMENTVIVMPNDIYQQLDDKSNDSVDKFDSAVVAQAEKAFGTTQLSFQIVLDECESVESYDDYVTFKNAMDTVSDDMSDLMRAVDDATKLLESSGYDTNPMIEQLITETRQAANNAGICMAGLINLYEN